jgi:hypothetical protein
MIVLLWKKRVVPLIAIPILGLAITFYLYGSPLNKIDLGIYQDGQHLSEPLKYQEVLTDSINFPRFVSGYVIYLDYHSSDDCFKDGTAEAQLRVDVKDTEPFAQYAKKVFPENSCYTSDSLMPQHMDGNYYFCVPVNSRVKIPYPPNERVSFSTFLIGSAPHWSNCFINKDNPTYNSLTYEDVHLYARQSWVAWSLNLFAIILITLFLVSSLLSLFDRIDRIKKVD